MATSKISHEPYSSTTVNHVRFQKMGHIVTVNSEGSHQLHSVINIPEEYRPKDVGTIFLRTAGIAEVTSKVINRSDYEFGDTSHYYYVSGTWISD